MNEQQRLCQKGKGKAGSSRFRGVTKHRWTGKFEAHLWDSSIVRKTKGAKGRTRGKQVYLGGFANEIEAAKAYDRAAVSYWGPSAVLNFHVSDYEEEMEMLESMNKEEVVAMLRRSSTGFSRGASKFRGVTRHHQHGKWEARIGRVAGNKYLYLGTFDSEEAAAEAYDRAAIKFRGKRAVTNFSITRYKDENIELSEESFEQQNDANRKRSRPYREEFKGEEDLSGDVALEDACSEVWCPLSSENPCSNQGASNEELCPCGSIFNPEENFGRSSDLYTQLLLGSDLTMGFECKDAAMTWNPCLNKDRRFVGSSCPLGMQLFPETQSGVQPCDGSSQVDVGHSLLAETGTVQKQPHPHGENCDDGGKRSGEKAQMECFSQDAWTGIMEGIPGSELAYLMAGDWLQDSTAAFDDILNNDI